MSPFSKSILTKVAYYSPNLVCLVKVMRVLPSMRFVANLSIIPSKFLIYVRYIRSGIHPVRIYVRLAISKSFNF
jgi:hypothetical protein